MSLLLLSVSFPYTDICLPTVTFFELPTVSLVETVVVSFFVFKLVFLIILLSLSVL